MFRSALAPCHKGVLKEAKLYAVPYQPHYAANQFQAPAGVFSENSALGKHRNVPAGILSEESVFHERHNENMGETQSKFKPSALVLDGLQTVRTELSCKFAVIAV